MEGGGTTSRRSGEGGGSVVGDAEADAVQAGTNSTTEQQPTTAPNNSHRDESVISVLTDGASMEGNNTVHDAASSSQPMMEDGTVETQTDPAEDVPKQVILQQHSDPDTHRETLGSGGGGGGLGTTMGGESSNHDPLRNGIKAPAGPGGGQPAIPAPQPRQRSDMTGLASTSMAIAPAPSSAGSQVAAASEQSGGGSDAPSNPSTPPNLAPNTSKLADSGGAEGVMEEMGSPDVMESIVERSPGERYVRFMEKLGSGASKDVYRAYDTQEGIEVAWNVVNLSGVPKQERNRIVNEVRLLERLHHHNIISFHGSWVNRERQEVIFVTEILSSGTLKSFINKVKVIRWKIAKRWAVQILHGLSYLHSQEPPVIHRDLKCDNVFINGTSGDLRIGDLGLSTVNRNGKVHSVLGTPEFMAPDMYEESSYDEKVDIYAFGMCMLEIFTQEIPYSECKNPAQIYKKVSNGEPPDVLQRLQSKHARDFVILCMGYKDQSGKYVRPSAAELLKHPFLVKRASDENEVVVDPPLRERVISESVAVVDSTSNSSALNNPMAQSQVSSNGGDATATPIVVVPATDSLSSPPQMPAGASGSSTKRPPQPRPRRRQSATTPDEEDGDRFEEMPQSETNIRKVKVLMGRGQELKEEEEVEVVEDDAGQQEGEVDTQVPRNRGETGGPLFEPGEVQVQQRNSEQSSSESQQQQVHSAPAAAKPSAHSKPAQQLQYLVAAAVIENEDPHVRPYADDVLKLVVTLPVEGQKQYVQFDFHLVEDDPVKVAKEMVQELDIPQGAVLEISETISGLACSARMKQDKYASRISNQQGHHPPQQQQHSLHSHVGVPGGSQYPATLNTLVSEPTSVTEYSVEPHSNAEQGQPVSNNYGGMHARGGTYPTHVGATGQDVSSSQHQRPQSVPIHSHAPNHHSADSPVPPRQQGSVPPPPPNNHTIISHASDSPATNRKHHSLPSNTPPLPHSAQPIALPVSSQGQVPATSSSATANPSDSNGASLPQHQNSSHAASAAASETRNIPLRQHMSNQQDFQSPGHPNESLPPPAATSIDVGSTGEGGVDEELRKLDEDFQKNIQRTKKVYNNRMGNLQRSQIEREAQHQKTLEKHEKERMEFEKRMQQEEEQQLRRIEQLQREWDKRRETIAQYKRRQQPGGRLEQPVNGIHHHHHHPSNQDTFSQEQQPPQQQQQQEQQHQSLVLAGGSVPVNGISHQRSTSTASVSTLNASMSPATAVEPMQQHAPAPQQQQQPQQQSQPQHDSNAGPNR